MFYNTNYIQNNAKVRYSKKGPSIFYNKNISNTWITLKFLQVK